MSIPSLVNEFFAENSIEFEAKSAAQADNIHQLAKSLGAEADSLLRIIAFKSHAGSVVAVLPYACLFDFKQFEAALGDEVKLYDSVAASQKLFKGCQVGCFAPIPEVFADKMIVDKRVFELDKAILQSGSSSVYLELQKSALESLYKNCQTADFAVSEKVLFARHQRANRQVNEPDISFTSLRLKQRVDETFDLPAMPEIAQDIMKLRVDPSADAARLAEIVCRDPSLAAQVISWASSPYYGYQGKVDSVNTAIARVLGFELVMNLALGISIGKSLKVPMEGPLGIRQFWRQAIYSANLSEKLCRIMPVKQRPERGLVYLSGLLHNFGHLLLGHIFPPQFSLLNKTIEANPHIPVEDIEHYILGVTHEEVGAWLMRNWHMPDELVVAVKHHHQEEFWSQHAVYSNIVLVANRMLKRLGIGDAVETELPKSTLELLSLDESVLDEMLVDIEAEAETLDMMAKQLVA